jgi:hypothetical protein
MEGHALAFIQDPPGRKRVTASWSAIIWEVIPSVDFHDSK